MDYFVAISLLVAFLYGMIPSIVKYILKDINIVTLLLCEALGVLTFTLLLAFFHKKDISKDLAAIRFRSIYSIGMLSFVIFIANCLLYLVVFNCDSYIVSALTSCSPIFALMISFFFIKESITPIHLLGVLFIVGGICCISA